MVPTRRTRSVDFGERVQAGVVLDVVATGALLVWALDEVVRGVNTFRQMLGAGVLLFVLTGLVAG
ncbi:MAG: hypothetical protein WCA29_09000 [Jiangellales bacterium]